MITSKLSKQLRPTILQFVPSVALLALITVAGELKPAYASTDADIRPLISQLVKAYGGAHGIREIEEQPYAVRARGHVHKYSSVSQAENEFDAEMVRKGDKVRFNTSVMNQEQIVGFNGTVGWIQRGDDIRVLDLAQQPDGKSRANKQAKSAADPHSLEQILIACTKPSTQIVSAADQEVDGKMCQGLVIRAASMEPTCIYIDPHSHLILRSEYESKTAGAKSVRETSDYLDYRPVFGFIRPFKLIDYHNGKKYYEQTNISIVRDDTVTDSYFEPPPKHQIAALEHGPVVIPVQILKHLVYVQVRVNDSKDCNLMVDTGYSVSTLRNLVARQFGPVGSGLQMDAPGGSVKQGSVVLNKVQLGDVVINNVTMGVAGMETMRRSSGEMRLDGCLGSDILSRFLVTIDYFNHKLILADPDKVVVPPQAVVLELGKFEGAPTVNGKLDDKVAVPFLVDTGAFQNNIPESLLQTVAPGGSDSATYLDSPGKPPPKGFLAAVAGSGTHERWVPLWIEA